MAPYSVLSAVCCLLSVPVACIADGAALTVDLQNMKVVRLNSLTIELLNID